MKKIMSVLRNWLVSRHRWLGRRDYSLVRRLLRDDEHIIESVYCGYQGGTGVFTVTNQRILLVDRRPFFDFIKSADFSEIRYARYKNIFLGGMMRIGLHGVAYDLRTTHDRTLQRIASLLDTCAENNSTDLVDVFTEIKATKQPDVGLQPQVKKAYRHPGWSPHNPIMMNVAQISGVEMLEE